MGYLFLDNKYSLVLHYVLVSEDIFGVIAAKNSNWY